MFCGKMHHGIANEFRKRYPIIYREYKYLCQSNELSPGDVFLYEENGIKILNMITQDKLGGAKLEYIEICFDWLLKHHLTQDFKSIAMSKIGAGLGGLDWSIIEEKLIEKFNYVIIKINVYIL